MTSRIDLEPSSREICIEVSDDRFGNPRVIPAKTWGEAHSASGAFLLVHGLGAHSGWFQAFGERLAKRGLFALAYDQAGFGQRRKEPFTSKGQWSDDLRAAYAYLNQVAQGKPAYLLGNSMGGVVAFACLDKVNPDGLVMCSPGFAGHRATFSLNYKLRAIFAAFARPDEDVMLPYTVYDITSRDEVREYLRDDPQRRSGISGKMASELLLLTLSTNFRAKHAACPVLLATAGRDKLVDNAVSERLFRRLKARSKHHIHYADAWHDLMFDPVLDSLVADICQWLEDTKFMKETVL